MMPGWGKKLSYCIAFGLDGAADVTHRYLRKNKFANVRDRCPEPVLPYILQEISTIRRKELADETRARLKNEDEREEKELRKFIADSIVKELSDAAKEASSAKKPNRKGDKSDTAAETEGPKQREAARRTGAGDIFYQV